MPDVPPSSQERPLNVEPLDLGAVDTDEEDVLDINKVSTLTVVVTS